MSRPLWRITTRPIPWPESCTTISFPSSGFPRSWCRTREPSSPEASSLRCASYLGSRRLGPHHTTRRPTDLLRGYTKHYRGWSASSIRKNARNGPKHIGSVLIDYNATWSQVTGYSPYFLMFGWRPRLPVDLLFPTVNTREWTRTINEYVKALYERLSECLQLAQESASKEAKRQKWLYNRRVGAVELHPEDCVLVHLDAFQGQHRKLKNQWGDDIHTMINRKATSIPVYEVKNERTGKRKVLHRARLLLWLTDYGEPVRCNLMTISNTLPGTVLGQQLEDSGEGLHPVPGDSLQYGLDLTHYMAIIDNPEPMTSHIGHKVCTGVPQQAAGQRIPTDCDKEPDSDCLGSYVGDVPVSWANGDRQCPHNCVPDPPKFWGDVTVPGELAVTGLPLFRWPKPAW